MPRMKTCDKSRILIVDDHPALREALATRISRQDDMAVCGEAGDLHDALMMVESLRPDLAVVDLSLKSDNGIDLIKQIKIRQEDVRVLVWSMHTDFDYADQSLRAGALGYIDKDQATDKIIEAIRCVLDGKLFLSDEFAQKLLQRKFGIGNEPERLPRKALAGRELEVLRMIGNGVRTSEIANRLDLSIKTIETYRDRIRRKLDLKDGTELTYFAVKWVLRGE